MTDIPPPILPSAPPPSPHQVQAHAKGTALQKIITACGLIATVGGALLPALSPTLGAQSAIIITAGAIVTAAGAVGHALTDSAYLGATDN